MRYRIFRLFHSALPGMVLGLAGAFAIAAAPEGFRGMKWGDPVARLPNALAVNNPPGCYANRREELRLATAPLFGVFYCFDNDKLVRVELQSATGEDNLKAFRSAVITIFGEPPPQGPDSRRNVVSFTAPNAPVAVTLRREVLGVHKYLLILEYRGESRPGNTGAEEGQGQDAKKEFGF